MRKQKYETVKTSTNLFKDNFDYIEKKAHEKDGHERKCTIM